MATVPYLDTHCWSRVVDAVVQDADQLFTLTARAQALRALSATCKLMRETVIGGWAALMTVAEARLPRAQRYRPWAPPFHLVRACDDDAWLRERLLITPDEELLAFTREFQLAREGGRAAAVAAALYAQPRLVLARLRRALRKIAEADAMSVTDARREYLLRPEAFRGQARVSREDAKTACYQRWGSGRAYEAARLAAEHLRTTQRERRERRAALSEALCGGMRVRLTGALAHLTAAGALASPSSGWSALVSHGPLRLCVTRWVEDVLRTTLREDRTAMQAWRAYAFDVPAFDVPAAAPAPRRPRATAGQHRAVLQAALDRALARMDVRAQDLARALTVAEPLPEGLGGTAMLALMGGPEDAGPRVQLELAHARALDFEARWPADAPGGAGLLRACARNDYVLAHIHTWTERRGAPLFGRGWNEVGGPAWLGRLELSRARLAALLEHPLVVAGLATPPHHPLHMTPALINETLMMGLRVHAASDRLAAPGTDADARRAVQQRALMHVQRATRLSEIMQADTARLQEVMGMGVSDARRAVGLCAACGAVASRTCAHGLCRTCCEPYRAAGGGGACPRHSPPS